MKKDFLSTVLAITLASIPFMMAAILTGCDERNPDGSYHAPKANSSLTGFHTIVIDSCEYIVDGNRLAHKGNCRFCKERLQKALQCVDYE